LKYKNAIPATIKNPAKILKTKYNRNDKTGTTITAISQIRKIAHNIKNNFIISSF